ncbi:PRP38 family protein [Cryptosporidium muris RN66]|uniref:Pre-mRNA-splicing factor 38 n=1 Tax=Cryptosporidium muris (strain RN66) TaxID=441375 RepID=B6AGF3_CRYMR|nr:PRP38 family protein [Cryptosporidium muris RN66]EEA07294.1 PRP38 family protein [Cryptosporidium muris RN66]|eukprot:XP_002141643.1 PRP38 family protein [Cryptosporidium muris RN66]
MIEQIGDTRKLFLISSILRNRVFSCIYWKSECFGLDSETILDKAIQLDYVGSTFGPERRPCTFLCLLVKLLQIQPSLDIILEYITNPEFKYLTALGIIYLRLVASPKDIYINLEPLYKDYRKLKCRDLDGSFYILCIDELIDRCLRDNVLFDIDLPYLPKRLMLVKEGILKFPRESNIKYTPMKLENKIRRKKVCRSNRSLSRSQSPEQKDLLPNKINRNSKEINLSVEEWNKLRKNLGIKPLK